MNVNDYKEAIRKYRGHLKSVDTELSEIWTSGSNNFIEFSLSNKSMGVRKMAEVANCMIHEDQDKFIVWMQEKVRKKNEIDSKLMEMI